MWYITKLAKNGVEVIYADKRKTNGKKFTTDLTTAFHFYSKEAAEAVLQKLYPGTYRIITETQFPAIEANNFKIQLAYRSGGIPC